MNRIARCIDEIQTERRRARFKELHKKFAGRPHIGLQLDMWTDSETHTAFACITATVVAEPIGVWHSKTEKPQLFLQNEIVSFGKFPFGKKTGEHIKQWFLKETAQEFDLSAVIGVTPDGAADGQCGLGNIDGLREKVDTCHLHRLQRALLFSIGIAGAQSKNCDFKKLLRQHSRIVQLTRQSHAVSKAVSEAQAAAQVPEHLMLATKKPSQTRWGGQYLMLHTNCLLKPALQPAVDDFKQQNRNNPEAIVEPNEDEQSSRAGRSVPTHELGLTSEQWVDSLHAEAYLKICFDVKETLEHKGYLTGAQSMMVVHKLMKDCSSAFSLSTLKFPGKCDVQSRDRAAETIEHVDVCPYVLSAAEILVEELRSRFFTERPSNSRLALAHMSKQKRTDKWMTPAQVELAKTCYLMMLREAHAIRFSSQHFTGASASARKRESPRLAKKRRLIDDSDSDDAVSTAPGAVADHVPSTADAVTGEIDSWKHMPRDTYKMYEDKDGIINEFQMMWELRESFPLHYMVFKQCAAHLLHEANVERIFSLAGRLADPSLDAANLELMVRVHFNKKVFMPTMKEIRSRYFRKYRKAGDLFQTSSRKGPNAEEAIMMDEDPGHDAACNI